MVGLRRLLMDASNPPINADSLVLGAADECPAPRRHVEARQTCGEYTAE
jgi:hypothetical protein